MKNNFDIKRVQNRLLDMGIEVAGILDKYSIPYMLAFGTLLGAVRHNGFIPWDDDFDFYLFDDTYDEAISVLKENIDESMFVENADSEPLYFHGWTHVKDLFSETICEEFPQDNLYFHRGISIDLYRAKKMRLSELREYLDKENFEYLMRRKNTGTISEDELKIRLEKLENNKHREYMKSGDADYEVYNLVPYYKRHFVLADDVFPLKNYVFENHFFLGPNHGERILRDIYGDYLQLPPVEQRRSHYSSVVFLNS